MVKGHTNIKNGYDQLLAFFNNSTWRSDLPYGRSGWGPKGKRRFKVGGVIDNEEQIIAGEDGKREAIIPLDRFRARAVQLFKFVGEELGFDMKAILGSGNFDISSSAILNNRAPSIGFSRNTSVDASGASKTSGDINITMPVEIHGGATREQADMFVSVALPKIKKELIKDMDRYAAKQGRKTK
jgi:SLT domain-containing protein